MIKAGREHGKGAPAAADILVCFPSRTHLRLMPKPICSPARPPEQPNKRLHHLKKSGSAAAGQASPLMWAKSKSFGGAAELVSEPTSPKVTCSGQIKVRHKGSAVPCKSWQSVMEEIEKMHKTNSRRKINGGSNKKRSGWAEALGLKKEVMQFLTCLRTIRLDFRCFGSFPGGADVTTDDEDDDDDDEEEEEEVEAKNEAESSRTVFSKWFMVLQEERRNCSSDDNSNDHKAVHVEEDDGGGQDEPAVPPPNALLLMRCRSAPAKSWLEEREEEVREREETSKIESKRSLRYLMAEDEKKKSVVLMKYEYDDMSSDIAKETWLVGGLTDHLARCRSWKR